MAQLRHTPSVLSGKTGRDQEERQWHQMCQADLIITVPESPKQDKPKVRNTPRHLLIKLTKIKHKEQILKAVREKQQITHKGIPIRIPADLSIETLQTRREWQDILKVMKENNLQPRLLYPARISFKYEGEIKSFIKKDWKFSPIGCSSTWILTGQLGLKTGEGFLDRGSCSEQACRVEKH